MRIKLDRSGKTLLSHQLAEWLKAAIRRGDYGDGDILPGIDEIARLANVGRNTAKRALSRLAREGWTKPTPHVGSVVVPRGVSTLMRRRILFFVNDPFYCYYFDQLLSSLRSGLARIRPGVSVTAISGAAGSNPCLQLEEFLKERWDLVIEILARPGASRLISASGLPFVSIRDGVRPRLLRPVGNCVGVVNTKTGMAIHDFASACLRRGVRSVLQVMALPNPYDVTDMLAVSEIRVTTLRVENPGMPEAVAMGGFSAVRDFFAAHPRNLPDLVLFTDDYAAQGGLIAMKSLGLRIPEDVAVVSHYNKGHGPIWEKPLTRLEMDPVAHGAALTRAFAAYLRGEPFPENFVLGSVWREGETF